MNTTVLVALITGLSATIPNVVMAIINNRYQLKLKRFETDELAKRQAIIDFSNSVEDCVSVDGAITIRARVQYQKALDKLLLYFPDINPVLIENIENTIHIDKIQTKQIAIQPLIRQLSKELFGKSKIKIFDIWR